jgi:hypothetical protein
LKSGIFNLSKIKKKKVYSTEPMIFIPYSREQAFSIRDNLKNKAEACDLAQDIFTVLGIYEESQHQAALQELRIFSWKKHGKTTFVNDRVKEPPNLTGTRV